MKSWRACSRTATINRSRHREHLCGAQREVAQPAHRAGRHEGRGPAVVGGGEGTAVVGGVLFGEAARAPGGGARQGAFLHVLAAVVELGGQVGRGRGARAAGEQGVLRARTGTCLNCALLYCMG